MIKKTSLTALCITAMLLSAVAQKNSIEISMGGYMMPGVIVYNHSMTNVVGLTLGRKINERTELTLGYVFPNAQGILTYGMGRLLSSEEILDSYDDLGKLFDRWRYHYWDAGVRYKIVAIGNHSLKAFQSISLAHGENDYLENMGVVPIPGNSSHTVFIEYETKKECYMGGTTGLSYDYTFWKNRINIGAHFAARYYLKNFPFQVNYGLHLGYNF